jgi:hypothetical protein
MVLVLATPSLFGQGETTGSISGIVQDSSGAAMPNAKVTLTNNGTGQAQSKLTDAGGNYDFTALNLGSYTLTVEAAGFRKFVQENITIHVNDRLRIDPSMQVGGQTETVTVSEQPSPVETEKPTLSGLVNETQVKELPLPNRNFMGLTLLVPGVTYTGSREISLGGLSGNPMFINGSRSTANNWMVDGSRNTDTGSNGTLFNYPSIDAIQEFRILTNSYDAQFGRNAGGIINVIVKSGTRDFHGSAYEFVRNDAFNARDALQFTRPIPDRDSLKTPYRYNNFGYSGGGPFFIPKLYPKSKSKTFFFWSEEWRKIRGYSVLGTLLVPTDLQRAGIFSVPVKDPVTGALFANNTIPANRIDPNAAALLKLGFWPEPNLPAAAGQQPNQFRFVGGTPTDFRQELVRVDQDVTDKWRLMVRYIHDQFQQFNPQGIWSDSTLPDLFSNSTGTPATNIVARSLNILNPHMLNEFQFDYATNAISSSLASSRGLLSNVPGFKVNPFYPTGPQHNAVGVLPGIGVSGLTGASPDVFPFFNENPSFTWQDNFTWTTGRHEFKFGGLYSSEHKNENAGGPNTNGFFNFNGNRSGNSSATAFADFLLGAPSSYTEDQTDVRVHVSYKAFEWYAQDNWKVTPRLTVTLGLRWSYFANPSDDLNVLVSFLPGRWDPSKAPKLNPNGTLVTDANGNVIGDRYNGLIFPKGVLAGHDSPWGNKVQNDSYTNFGPRIGFAFDPSGKGLWAFRGGYGIYYDRSLVGIIEQNGFSDPLVNATVNIDNPTFTDPHAGLARNAVSPLGITSVGTPFIVPQTQQWNLNVQRNLFSGTLVQVAYAGSAGNHQLRDIPINRPALNAAAAVGGVQNLVRPYQGYASINDRETRSSSRYHALQVLFRHTMSRWLTANVSYTWSRVMTDSSADRGESPQDISNLRAEKAPASYDRTQVLTPSLVWSIPYGKTWRAPLRLVAGGWEVASIMNFWTGVPLTVTQSGDPYFTGATYRPDVIGTPAIHNSIQTRLCYIFSASNPNCAGLSGSNAFIAVNDPNNPNKTPHFGNAARNILRGPGINNFDIAAYKNFVIRENGPKFQFRAESFNAFNHFELGNPGTNISTSTFGQITGNRGARVIQLGLKFGF